MASRESIAFSLMARESTRSRPPTQGGQAASLLFSSGRQDALSSSAAVATW
jgi:hypothetical protein